MKLDFCAVCGTTKDLHQHHIEPVVYSKINRKAKSKRYDGEKKLKDCDSFEVLAYLFDKGFISDDETITVCSYHHNLLHGIIRFQKYEHSKMIKEGQKNAIAKGIKIGRPTKLTDTLVSEIIGARNSGMPIKKIAKHFDIGVGTVYDAIGKMNEP
jgi:uncharacterized protein (DUF433 family)